MTFKGSQTEMNLLTAFAGESQARNRYTFYASAAKKEGLDVLVGIFQETANQECAHAKRLFKFLEGGDVTITASFPAGVIGKSAANLKAAAAGEHEEWTHMYPAFAKTARAEGFENIAKVLDAIAVVERQHEKRYSELLQLLEAGKLFKRDEKTTWRCQECGYLHEGTEAPAVCPACAHSQSHFDVLAENW